MSYHFTHGSEVTFVVNFIPKTTTTTSTDFCYNSDGNYIHDDDEIKFAETTSLYSEERASIRKLYSSNEAARVQLPPTLL